MKTKTTQAILFRTLLAAGLTFSVACTQSKNTGAQGDDGNSVQSTESQVIQNVASNVILATYQGLSNSTAQLRDQIVVLEAAPTQDNLNKAQDLWKQCRLYWESTEAFLFGPVESLSVDPMIDTWPLNRSDLDAILASSSAITPDVLRTMGTNLKGFHTVEYLLFGNGLVTNNKPVSALTAREVEYLKATTVVLAEDTERLTSAWTTHSDPDKANSPSYFTILTQPNLSNAIYGSKQAVILELINGMVGIADEVGSGKIADPLGSSQADANPTAEESPFSWNSVSDFSNNIRSIRLIYDGGLDTTNAAFGVRALVEQKNPALAAQVQNQIDLAIQKIQDISSDGTPFGKAILSTDGRVRVLAAQQEVNKLFTILKQQVLPLFQ